MTESQPFIQCHFCKCILTMERAPQLFRAVDNTYRLRCVGCDVAACEQCAALAFFSIVGENDDDDGEDGCFKCAPAKWETQRYFGIQYYFSLLDRYRQESACIRNHPDIFATQRAAMGAAIAHLPVVLRTLVDAALSAEAVRDAEHKWSGIVAERTAAGSEWDDRERALQTNTTTIPWFVFIVPTVRMADAAATVTILCFPLSRHIKQR